MASLVGQRNVKLLFGFLKDGLTIAPVLAFPDMHI